MNSGPETAVLHVMGGRSARATAWLGVTGSIVPATYAVGAP